MFRSSYLVLMFVLWLSSACGAQTTSSTAVPAATTPLAGSPAVSAGAYTDADLTQAIVLDLMESRIKQSLPAWKAAAMDPVRALRLD